MLENIRIAFSRDETRTLDSIGRLLDLSFKTLKSLALQPVRTGASVCSLITAHWKLASEWQSPPESDGVLLNLKHLAELQSLTLSFDLSRLSNPLYWVADLLTQFQILNNLRQLTINLRLAPNYCPEDIRELPLGELDNVLDGPAFKNLENVVIRTYGQSGMSTSMHYQAVETQWCIDAVERAMPRLAARKGVCLHPLGKVLNDLH